MIGGRIAQVGEGATQAGVLGKNATIYLVGPDPALVVVLST